LQIKPFAEISELKSELLIKVRKMAANERANHPWKSMNDLELLKSAGLYLKDPQSGEEGLVLEIKFLEKLFQIYSFIENLLIHFQRIQP